LKMRSRRSAVTVPIASACSPLLEDADVSFSRPFSPRAHPLLGLGEHHLVGGHAGLALRDLLMSISIPVPAARPHPSRARGPAAPMSWMPTTAPVHPGLPGRPRAAPSPRTDRPPDGGPRSSLPPRTRPSHGRPVDPVASRLRAHVETVCHPLGAAEEDLGPLHEPARRRHQRVLAVAVLEHHSPPTVGSRGYRSADPGNDPRQQRRFFGRWAPKRSEFRTAMGARPGEDVAQDPAHAGAAPGRAR